MTRWPFAALCLLAGAAHADIIVAEIAACRGRAVGDVCAGGRCVSDGFSCQAGSCRRFDDEAACRADACQWVEGFHCAPDTPPAPAPIPPSTPTSSPSPSAGCGTTPPSMWAIALVVLGLRRRRRRHV